MKSAMAPIKPEHLREIIAELGLKVPSDEALKRLAVVLTWRQPQYAEEGYPGFPMHTVDALGNEYIIESPLFPHRPRLSSPDQPDDWKDRLRPDGTFMGHPRRGKTWRDPDIAKDIADEFYRAMGRTFGKRGITADFLAQVIPLVTGERPSAKAIGQWLVQPRR